MKTRIAVSISLLLVLIILFTGCGGSDDYVETCTLTITVIGEGTVLINPDKTEYWGGEEITLTAVPESNWEFVHWEGADCIPSASENPIIITIPMSISIVAVFNMGMQWSFDTGGQVESSPAIGADGTIYVVSAGVLYAINPDGSEKWTFASGTICNSPSIGADGTVYVGSGDSSLYAVNPNGTEDWSYPMGNTPVTCPTIGPDGTIYVGQYGYILYAIDSNGTYKWSFQTDVFNFERINCSPSIAADGTIYLGTAGFGYGKVYAINPNGTEKWSFPTGDYVKSSPAIGADGTIYIGSLDSNFYAINPDGSEKWSFTSDGSINTSPAIGADGTVYFGSEDYHFYAINADGSEKWSIDDIYFYMVGSNREGSGPAIGKDGTIYIGSYRGGEWSRLYSINSDGSVKWFFKMGGIITSSPVIGTDGTVYVGSWDESLYAINSSSLGLADSPWPMFLQNERHTGLQPTP